MSTAELTPPTVVTSDREGLARLTCFVAGVLALVPFALCQLSGSSGAEITAGLERDVVELTTGSIVAVLVSAALMLCAARLALRVRGAVGLVLGAAGCAVALMYALYYAVFGAGAVVATQSLEDPGAGLGEAASLMLNITEIARYAPGLALVAAAVAARRVLPKPVWITAAGLVVLSVFPLTSWVAALLIPLWLAVCAAGAGQNRRSVASSIPRRAS
jgi:hypothetical protein